MGTTSDGGDPPAGEITIITVDRCEIDHRED